MISIRIPSSDWLIQKHQPTGIAEKVRIEAVDAIEEQQKEAKNFSVKQV